MVEKKKSLKPLETMNKQEREALYKHVHNEVQSYNYESQTIRLLKKEKKQREIEDQLADKITEYKKKNQELEIFWDKLKKNQEEEKEVIERKKIPIQSLSKIRDQEEEKIKQENEALTKKKSEIEEKLKEKMKVEENLAKIERKIEDLLKYKEVLEKVVENCEDYDDISQLITRCQTLQANLKDLNNKHSVLETETQNEKKNFVEKFNKLSEETGLYRGKRHTLESEIEDLNNIISEQQLKQEQEFVSRIEQKALKAKMNLSIKNIYNKALLSKSSLSVKNKEGEEKKAKNDSTKSVKVIKNSTGEGEENPDALVFMLQKIKERYCDLERIKSEASDEIFMSKPVPLNPQMADDVNKSRSAKKIGQLKAQETSRTVVNIKDR